MNEESEFSRKIHDYSKSTFKLMNKLMVSESSFQKVVQIVVESETEEEAVAQFRKLKVSDEKERRISTIYVDSFILPSERREEAIIDHKIFENGGYIDNVYPCRLFTKNALERIDFDKITIIYGGNGSGKSTLLNLIASKLEIKRIAPFNSSELFDRYVDACKYELGYDDEGFRYRIPNGSRIITSDDIFDYMLTVRTNNDEVSDEKQEAFDKYEELKFAPTIKVRGFEDFEILRQQVMARKKSVTRRKFIRTYVGEETKLNSNGETALSYFESKLKCDTLYCLDEPENSLSPKLQLELVQLIERMARYCGCQFIIATHSPFLLAMDMSKIYDLDTHPVNIRKWWELENTKTYFDFFYQHRDKFLPQINQ